MNDLTMIWNEVISMLEIRLNPIQLKNWIQPLVPLTLENQVLWLDTTSAFIHSMVDKKYREEITYCATYICETPITLQLVDPSMEEYDRILMQYRNSASVPSDAMFSSESWPAEKPTSPAPSTLQPRVEQRTFFEQDRMDTPFFRERTQENRTESEEMVRRVREKKEKLEQQRKRNGYGTLNPKYTMDSFVRGASNDFAYATAKAVIKAPGRMYNPLFIYGLSGLGKTHLMQAIAHEILNTDPEKRVLYITSENFMNEMIKVIENGTNAEKENFRHTYRSIDVLLIDDIQFIAGKKATMEEVFHTFNDLKEAGKQIVLSADKPPKELKNLEDRLVTRFEGGMTVDIQQPDFETRVAILNHKMKEESMTLPQYVIEFIASHVTSNIRELEGALLRVLAYFRFKEGSGELSRDEALSMARESLKLEERNKVEISTEEILRRVAEYYHLRAGDLTSKSRQGVIVLPRQIAMFLCRELTNLSLVAIGRAFHRDHTTVMHAVDKIAVMKQEEDTVKTDLDALITQLTHV